MSISPTATHLGARRRRAQVAMSLVLLVAVLAPGSVAAQRIWVLGPDPAMVDQVCAALEARGASRADSHFKSARATLRRDYQGALKQIEVAKQAYQRGKTDRAWREISNALTTIERSFAAVESFDAVTRAYLFQADLATARGDRRLAEDAFLIAARFGGEMKLDPASTSPLVIEGYKAAKELLANSPTGGLTVVSEPAGADVIVDGVASGVTPVSVVLPAGPHLVTVRTDGFDVWATQVPLDPDSVRKVEVFLSAASLTDAAAQQPSPEKVLALAGLDGEADWLVVWPEAEGISYSVLSAAGGGVQGGGPLALEQLDSALASHLSATDKVAADPAPLPDWVWMSAAAAGGVVLLGGATAAILAIALSQEPEPSYVSVFHR